MGRRGELWGGRAAGRVPGAVKRMTFIPVAEAIEYGRAFLDFATPTRAVAKEFADTMAHSGQPLLLVLMNAGLVQRDGEHRDGLLVCDQGHDLDVVEACDGFAIDMRD